MSSGRSWNRTALAAEARRFAEWCRRTRQRELDWWACYPFKDDLYRVVKWTVRTQAITPATADQLLDLLGRDAENGAVLDIIGTNPTCSYQLAEHGRAHEEPKVRAQLALLLGRIGGLGAVDVLRELAFDDDEIVRANAIASLQTIDPGVAAMVLQQYLQSAPDER